MIKIVLQCSIWLNKLTTLFKLTNFDNNANTPKIKNTIINIHILPLVAPNL